MTGLGAGRERRCRFQRVRPGATICVRLIAKRKASPSRHGCVRVVCRLCRRLPIIAHDWQLTYARPPVRQSGVSLWDKSFAMRPATTNTDSTELASGCRLQSGSWQGRSECDCGGDSATIYGAIHLAGLGIKSEARLHHHSDLLLDDRVA